jgi:hypothetical protein
VKYGVYITAVALAVKQRILMVFFLVSVLPFKPFCPPVIFTCPPIPPFFALSTRQTTQ